MESTADYINTTYTSREAYAARLLALANGELTDPDSLDPVEDADEYQEALEALQGDDFMDEDAAQEALDQFPLAIDRKILVRVQLGFGGPSDWIDAECSAYDGSLGIDSATHYAVWGSDSKETRLSSSDALWKLAERYIEGMEA